MDMLAHVRRNATDVTEKSSSTSETQKQGQGRLRPAPARNVCEDGRGVEGAKPLLGIYTKNASAISDSGAPKAKTPPLTAAEASKLGRAKMWRLKSVVNGLLAGKRPSMCMKYMNAQTVDIKKNAETHKCSFTGLVVCGSVWSCPNCSRRISEKRREELAQVVAKARSQGETVLMVTQTFSHHKGDVLVETIDKLTKAQRYFTGGRAMSSFRKELELDGTIRALEITFGRNGWHPHFHTLYFLRGMEGPTLDGGVVQVNRLRLKRLLFVLWWKACQKAGLKTSYKHGLDVSAKEREISTYIAKWGIETEMTKANFKTGEKKDSVTPWGMLQHIAEKGEKTQLYTAKFVEYSDAMKGQRQLYWSNGLRARLSVAEELSDVEIVKQDMKLKPSDIILASLTIDQWYPITRYNLESALLDVAEAKPADILQFVLGAKHRYLQEKSDRECDRKGVSREIVPMPSYETKLFTPKPVHNGERLADKVDKELVFF